MSSRKETAGEFRLYGTSACHLCEIAADMVQAWRDSGLQRSVRSIDIADSDELFQRYGESIPVLQHPDGSELYWPFTIEELGQFLSR